MSNQSELVPTERVKEILEDGFLKHGESKLLARELLAYREAAEKPVAYIDNDELERLADNDSGVVRTPNFGPGYQSATIPLFTAPPLPIVPGAIPKVADGDKFKYVKDGTRFSVGYANGWNDCRTAMLNHSEDTLDMVNSQVIPDGWALVPIEPTEKMMLHKSECQHHAWDDHDCAMRQTRRLVWANMIAAAPKLEV